jgi:hypothetical protein
MSVFWATTRHRARHAGGGVTLLEAGTLHFLDDQRSVTGLTHPSRIPPLRSLAAQPGGEAWHFNYIQSNASFGMVLAMALIIGATTWAFSPNPNGDPAAPIPLSEAIYQVIDDLG